MYNTAGTVGARKTRGGAPIQNKCDTRGSGGGSTATRSVPSKTACIHNYSQKQGVQQAPEIGGGVGVGGGGEGESSGGG